MGLVVPTIHAVMEALPRLGAQTVCAERLAITPIQ